MINIPIIRWGKPYESLEIDEVLHFATGEPIAKVSQTNGGIISRDMRKSKQARDKLREIPCSELLGCLAKAADLYENESLPIGDAMQTPDEFAHQQFLETQSQTKQSP